MAPENVGPWEEYRRLVISWHEDEVEERKAIKAALESYQEITRKEHAEVMKTLNILTTERDQARRWVGPAVAALVAALVSGTAKAFGF